MRLAPADPIATAISAPMPFDAPVSSMVLPARSTIALPPRARLLLTETCILLEYTFPDRQREKFKEAGESDMVMREQSGHPWMGNSLPALKQQMLDEIGVGSIGQLFEQIPEDHRLREPLDLPLSIRSESALRRHLTDMLSRNESADTHLTFLGAGCWPHHVPAVVDEIVGRTEFLTPVWGSAQSDFGRNQA